MESAVLRLRLFAQTARWMLLRCGFAYYKEYDCQSILDRIVWDDAACRYESIVFDSL